MTQILRHTAYVAIFTLPLLAGCASDGCKYLVYEDELPQTSPPLVIPAGVNAPAASGEFRVPAETGRRTADVCMARPPMTLPDEVLNPPESDAAPAETGDGTQG